MRSQNISNAPEVIHPKQENFKAMVARRTTVCVLMRCSDVKLLPSSVGQFAILQTLLPRS